MASLRRHPKSRYWYACITLPDGRQTQRSTRETDRKTAMRKAEIWEDAWKRGLNEAQARRVISDLYNLVHGERLLSATIGDYFKSWIERKKEEASPATWTRYQSIVKQFLTYLGEKADRDLSLLTSRDVTLFRDGVAAHLTAATANLSVKVLRVALMQAHREGLIQSSPASLVKSITRRGAEAARRPFTLPELERALEVADPEWYGIILFGLYTGQRLKDIATLTWQNIDLIREEVRLYTAKTNRRQIIPLAVPVLRHLESLNAGDDPAKPLFPKTAATVDRHGDVRSLSGQFHRILVAAGLAPKRSRENTGRGHSVKSVNADPKVRRVPVEK